MTEGNIYTALAAAQLEFGAVKKGATNPAFKSRYADLADVAAVVIPTLAGHGVAVLHYLVRDDLSAMRTEFVHGASGSKVFCDVPLLVDKNNMQGMKSATTYAKRIGLESLSGVAPEDDDGNAASQAPAKQSRAEPSKQDARDPAKIEASLIAAIAKAETAEALDAKAAQGTTFSEAWDWLKAHHADRAELVWLAFNCRGAALAGNADLGGDEVPF